MPRPVIDMAKSRLHLAGRIRLPVRLAVMLAVWLLLAVHGQRLDGQGLDISDDSTGPFGPLLDDDGGSSNFSEPATPLVDPSRPAEPTTFVGPERPPVAGSGSPSPWPAQMGGEPLPNFAEPWLGPEPDCGIGPGSQFDSSCEPFSARPHPLRSLFRFESLDHMLNEDLGHPLLRESWMYRPFSVGWFMGVVQGSTVVDDWLGQKAGYFGGYRIGWDANLNWGAEMRFAFGSIRLYDSPRAVAAQHQADTEAGFPLDDPRRDRFDVRRDMDLGLWDISLLYYPWGDTQWRLYFLLGLGTARVGYVDRLHSTVSRVVIAMPIAIGMKYRCNSWLALRFEVADNMAFAGGSGFNTLHEFSITGGMEIRFGGTRKAYWPWNPGRHYW